MWLLLIGNIIFWTSFALWRHRGETEPAEAIPPGGDVFRILFMSILGAISLAIGIAGYFLILFTNCFTFNFTKPFWTEMKAKIYFANIFIPLAWSLGIGLI